MILPFFADQMYQTVKRGMSMIRAIKAGQLLYAYTSSTGAVIDATTAATEDADDVAIFGLAAHDADAVVQVTVPAVKAVLDVDLVLTSAAITDAAYLAGAEWSSGAVAFIVKSVSTPEGADSAFAAVMRVEAKVAGITGNVAVGAALTTEAAATNLTSAAVSASVTPGAASYLATPLRAIDVVVSGAIGVDVYKDANGVAPSNQIQDSLRKINILVR